MQVVQLKQIVQVLCLLVRKPTQLLRPFSLCGGSVEMPFLLSYMQEEAPEPPEEVPVESVAPVEQLMLF